MVMCCMHKILLNVLNVLMRTFQWCSGKESNSNVGDTREAELIPGSGRSPRRGNSNALQCSFLEDPKDRGAWWATVCGVAKSQTE